MQFSAVVVALFANIAAASPVLQERASLCSSALDTAQCCSVSVDGLLVLDCATPSPTPANVSDFESICSAAGQSAQCCTLPLLGDALLCTAA